MVTKIPHVCRTQTTRLLIQCVFVRKVPGMENQDFCVKRQGPKSSNHEPEEHHDTISVGISNILLRLVVRRIYSLRERVDHGVPDVQLVAEVGLEDLKDKPNPEIGSLLAALLPEGLPGTLLALVAEPSLSRETVLSVVGQHLDLSMNLIDLGLPPLAPWTQPRENWSKSLIISG